MEDGDNNSFDISDYTRVLQMGKAVRLILQPKAQHTHSGEDSLTLKDELTTTTTTTLPPATKVSYVKCPM